MPALITVYQDGRKVAQCDAKCYNATRDHCRCVCAGVNHGVGLAEAARNTVDLDNWNVDPHASPKMKDDFELRKHHRLSFYAHPTFFPTD